MCTTRNKKYWINLCDNTRIIGLVLSNDSIVSKCTDVNEEWETHVTVWGEHAVHCAQFRWIWHYDHCIHSFANCNPDIEVYDRVRNYLTRKYGIPFAQNGYHDLDKLEKLCGYE